jgi:SRSO17 transposase
MVGRFELRLSEMLEQAEVGPELSKGILQRLQQFVEPFGESLASSEQQRHTQEYVTGLLSKLARKTGEAIAYLHDQDRQGIQKFIGQIPWDHQPLLKTLARQVGEQIGVPEGVIVFDPSSFAKKGNQSVGVARQWCGRLGKIENCQVGIYLGYVSCKEHALVDVRLYLPRKWTENRQRCREAGVPGKTRFRTRHSLALEMLKEHASALPHRWVTGDDEMGRSSRFRTVLRERKERYLLAVPSNTRVRDLESEAPSKTGLGRMPQRPFQQVAKWCSSLPEVAWTRIDVRDGEKGPLVTEALQRRVQTKQGQRNGPEEILVVTRERQSDGDFKHDYYLAYTFGEPQSLAEFCRVAKAEHRIEECLQRNKSEAGLASYQVRNWIGWHHHQALSLLAGWFLNQELRRGKKKIPVLTMPRLRDMIASLLEEYLRSNKPPVVQRRTRRWLRRNEQARFYHHHARKLLPALKNRLRL